MRALVLTLLASAAAFAADATELRLEAEPPPAVFRPLDPVTVLAPTGGTLSVLDARGREYVRRPAAERLTFLGGGAAGTHTARLLDEAGETRSSVRFRLEPRTEIRDASGRMEELLGILYSSMQRWTPSLSEGVGVLRSPTVAPTTGRRRRSSTGWWRASPGS